MAAADRALDRSYCSFGQVPSGSETNVDHSNNLIDSGAGQSVPPFTSTTSPIGLTFPPPRYLPQLRLLKRVGEQRGRLGVHPCRLPALGLGVHRVEVHKPGLEDGAGDRFQRLVHAAVELDLVVEGAENVSDGMLFP